MKIINLTLLLLLGSFSLFAQDEETQRSSEVKLTKSEEYPVVDAYRKMYFPVAGNNVLSVKIQGRRFNKFIFQVFDGPNLNLKNSVTELMEEKGFHYEYIIEIKDKLYFFYSIYDKQTEQLFVRTINTKDGGFESEAKMLIDVPRKLTADYSRSARGKYAINLSDNEEVFAIKYRYQPEERNDSKSTDVIGMQVFDSGLEKIWGSDFTMPYTESLMDNLDFAVNSEGSGFFLIRKYKEAPSRKTNQDPTNQSLAILIAGSDGELNEVEFNLGDYLANQEIYLKENNNGDIICAGYYRKPKSYGVDGTFVSILDSKGNLSDPKLYEFSLDFIKQYNRISERGKKKMEKADQNDDLSMTNLTMREVKVLADGGIILAGEIFYITSYTDARGNTHTTYHYEDVVMVKINADGELGWMEKLPKSSTFESFRLMTSEKYCYVLFIDHIRNEAMTDEGDVDMEIKGSNDVMAHRIDNNTGERKYLPLFDWRKIDGIAVYQYSLNRVIALSDKSFAIELYIKSKSDMMFKVEFEE